MGKKSNVDMIKEAAESVGYNQTKKPEEVFEKRLFMAQKELMNKSESLVDVIINLNNIVKSASERWDVGYEYLMEWLLEVLPFKKTDDGDTEDEE